MPHRSSAVAAEKTFLGQPRGLATLFFTEMWERFSYYGMRALLILFMTATTISDNPGMGFDIATAAAIYGLYTSFVYLLALPGGWVADNLWGQRKAIYVGGWIIAAGHFSMAIPSQYTFFGGLILIVIGTGLLKPNVSSVVADLYPEGGAARDAGFSVFYMGINLGGFLGPLVCSYLGETFNWHWGFSAAGFGMILGLIQFKAGYKYLGKSGLMTAEIKPEELRVKERKFYLIAAGLAAVVALFGLSISSGLLELTLTQVAEGLGSVILILIAVFFGYLLLAGGLSSEEKRRIGVIAWMFVLAAIFWSGFEQAGSSLNLFAKNLTDRVIFDWEMPAGWLQSVNSLFIIIFAPLFGTLWIWLAGRNANPSTGVKFALGLLGLGAGFFVLAWGAAKATEASPVSPSWLVVTYFFHTVGELCLSPVGMSTVTKLAPKGRVSQMMGIWFIATALGNLFAGLVAGRLDSLAPSSLFMNVAMIVAVAGLVSILVSPVVRKMMRGVE